jgi:hypothetical protein
MAGTSIRETRRLLRGSKKQFNNLLLWHDACKISGCRRSETYIVERMRELLEAYRQLVENIPIIEFVVVDHMFGMQARRFETIIAEYDQRPPTGAPTACACCL